MMEKWIEKNATGLEGMKNRANFARRCCSYI